MQTDRQTDRLTDRQPANQTDKQRVQNLHLCQLALQLADPGIWALAVGGEGPVGVPLGVLLLQGPGVPDAAHLCLECCQSTGAAAFLTPLQSPTLQSHAYAHTPPPLPCLLVIPPLPCLLVIPPPALPTGHTPPLPCLLVITPLPCLLVITPPCRPPEKPPPACHDTHADGGSLMHLLTDYASITA